MTHKENFKQNKKTKTVILSLTLLIVVSVGVTIAYLVSQSNPVVNKFLPSHVKVEVVEDFDGTHKKKVNVKNTGNTEAYIRVKLVSYRVSESELDEDGKPVRIGGNASIDLDFTLGENWVEHNDFYYYTMPVNPDESPKENLIGEPGITLKKYGDADGGKQVIEVMAEGIQSTPKEAVKEAWGQDVFDLLGGAES